MNQPVLMVFFIQKYMMHVFIRSSRKWGLPGLSKFSYKAVLEPA